jgi:transposase
MYREVTMVEVKEVLRLWRAGVPRKRVAAQLGLAPRTVRRYLEAATAAGVRGIAGIVTDDEVRDTLLALQPMGGRLRGEGWALCEAHRSTIERWLGDGLRLTKIQKLLTRQSVAITYPTLYRFAVSELQFGQTATTIPVLDGAPGQELQLDTGWVGWLTLPAGRRRRFRAWIFTAVRSRHRFVYPAFEETTARAIAACEAAWAFFGGIFAVIIPDNTKAIIVGADPLAPRITPAFLEYAQARHFHIDPARVRAPQDKGRVERAVPGVRDDCFAGEVLLTLDDAHARARTWCLDEYGLRRHSRTQRRPLEHFRAEELLALQPAPTTPYDIPLWSTPKVARDQLASVAKATYSLPHPYVGQTLTARADTHTVRFYLRGLVVKTHARRRRAGKRWIRRIIRPRRASTPCATSPRCSSRPTRPDPSSVASPQRSSIAHCPGRACAACMRCSVWSGGTGRPASPTPAPSRSRPTCSMSTASSACSRSASRPHRPRPPRGRCRGRAISGRRTNTPSRCVRHPIERTPNDH